MLKFRDIQFFIKGQPFAEGLRTAFCMLLPVIVFSLMGYMKISLLFALGVLIVSIPDMLGPIKERRNTMFINILQLLIISIATKFIIHSDILIGVFLVSWSFITCMLAVYGIRAAALGAASLLTFFFNMNSFNTGIDPLLESLFMTLGGVWYALFTLTLNMASPYKPARQSLSVCIKDTADFLRTKSEFFDDKVPQEEVFKKLIKQNIKLNQKQDTVRDLLITSKQQVRDTNLTSRMLNFVFINIMDIYESLNASHYDYEAIREKYGHTKAYQNILPLIDEVADAIEHLALAINGSAKSKSPKYLKQKLEEAYKDIEKLEAEGIDPIVIKKIYLNCRFSITKLDEIHSIYMRNDFDDQDEVYRNMHRFIKPKKYPFSQFMAHLSLKSPVFRHSVRVTVAMLAAYIISFWLPIKNNVFWIFITILVILRPAYSISKSRMFERLYGTLIGGLIGFALAWFVNNPVILFVIMAVCMVFTFTFIRSRYLYGSLFLTTQVILSYYLLAIGVEDGGITLIQERIIDTIIGCGLSFIVIYLVLPNWESDKAERFLADTLEANIKYLNLIFLQIAANKVDLTEYKLARKDVYLNLANISSLLQRILSEPKSKRPFIKNMNDFSVFNHILISYSTALMNVIKNSKPGFYNENHAKLMRKILHQLSKTYEFVSKGNLKVKPVEIKYPETNSSETGFSSEAELIEEELSLIFNISQDLDKSARIVYEKINE